MKIAHDIREFRLWRNGLAPDLRLGFTPTMGALHEGHLHHIRTLKGQVDVIAASVFVNPTQFGPGEDFDKYPRDLEGDAQKLKEAGCDILLYPTPAMMYPEGYETYVTVHGVSEAYEGAHRPDHFRGVATVVCKLLNIVRPHIMTLGRKDAQQLAVVRAMVRDLNIDTEILPIDTVREEDGVAMSSRNVYLSDEERSNARTISAALKAGREAIESGSSIGDAERIMRDMLSDRFNVDYFDIVDGTTFRPADRRDSELLGVFAGHIGSTRLIDNMVLKIEG